MRRRVPGYITKSIVSVPEKEGITPGDDGTHLQISGQDNNFEFNEVFPPGEIGSEEGRDRMEPTPMTTHTVEYARGEQTAPLYHGALHALQGAGESEPISLRPYAELTPRTAPLPCAGQDEGFLRIGVADPLMTDRTSTVEGRLESTVYGKSLYGRNEAGVLHNQNHPGFAAVQSKIQSEGYSKQSAGAILASASRNASKDAHKANPRLNKVKG